MKREIKKGKIVEEPEYIYLIPEFVSPTGMNDKQRSDHGIMKLIAPFTKLTHEQRVKNCQFMVEKFNNQEEGLIKIGGAKTMEGYILDKPELAFGSGKTRPDEKGTIKNRSKLKNTPAIKDWVFVYSIGKRAEQDDNEADKAVELLRKAGNTYGINLSEPGFITVEGRKSADWVNAIKGDIEKNNKPELVVCFVNGPEEKYYSELKRWLLNDIHVPCQFIRRRTLGNPKGAMSAASKIDIQMCTKVGGTPWEVTKSHPYYNKKQLMYGALSLSKGKKGFTLAFVGTCSNDCTKVYSECKVGIKRKE